MTDRRVDIRAILANPTQRRDLMIRCIIAIQAREGITTTPEQAAAAYDKVQAEVAAKAKKPLLDSPCPECGTPLDHPIGGGVVCPTCNYMFCF